jgi:hypothetical protein
MQRTKYALDFKVGAVREGCDLLLCGVVVWRMSA